MSKNPSGSERALSKYADWLIKYKWLAFSSVIILVVALAFGAKYTTIDGDLNIFFGKNNPQLKALNKIHDEYEKTDNLLIVVESKKKNVFTPNQLGIIESLVSESWKAPFVTRVDAITNFQHARTVNDDLVITDLVENANNKTPEEIKKIRDVALGEYDLVNRLVSPDGKVAGIHLTLKFPKKDFMNEGKSLVKHVKEVLTKYESEDVNFRLTGTVMVDQAFAQSGEQDMSTLMPLMFLVITVIIWVFFRSVLGTIATLIIVFFSTAVSIGIFGYLGIPLNSTTASAPIMIMTIVIADCVHFFSTVVINLNKGFNKYEAIKDSVMVNFKPILLTSITTMFGYLSMNFSDSPPFQQLGNIVAIGTGAGFFFSIYWLPSVLAIIPLKAGKRNPSKKINLEPVGNFVVRNKYAVVISCVILIASSAFFAQRNTINDMFLNFFDDDLQIKKDTRFTVDNLTGIYTIEYSLGAGGQNKITDPEYLKKIEEFEQWFKKQDKVIHVSSFAETMRRINKIMHYDSLKYYKIPEEKTLAGQFLLLYEMSLPYGVNLTNQINLDKSATRFRVIFENMYTSDLKKIETAANQWLKDNAPEHMYFNGTSTSVMFRYLSERNIDFMLYGFATAILIISLTLVLATRSVKYGLFSMLPNIVPSLIAFGIWGLLVGEVGLSVAFVTSFTLGIVVDDTIHFISKYIRGRREFGFTPEEAVAYTFRTAAPSMLITSIVLVAGFLVLTFSPFQLNAHMGILCAITIAVALILDFLLVPAMLIIIDGPGTKKQGVKPREEKKQEVVNV